MTAVVSALRPGLGWVGLAAVGVLVAGAGLMLAVLPFSRLFDIPVALGDGEFVSTPVSHRCATPLANAFGSEPPLADTGWFAYAPDTGVLFDSGRCVEPARWRLGLGVAALAVGSSTAVIAKRRIPLATA